MRILGNTFLPHTIDKFIFSLLIYCLIVLIFNFFALLGSVRGLLNAPIFSKIWFFRLIRGGNINMLLFSLLLKLVPGHHPTFMHDKTLISASSLV